MKITGFDDRFHLLGEVQNGLEALEAIGRRQPDFLFTDLRMPVMDGLKLLEEVYYNYPDIITVIISGYEDFSYAQKAISLEALGYLLKPVEPANLEIVLRKGMDRLERARLNCSYDSSVGKYAQETLASGVAEFIKANYQGEISINSLAEKFHVNPTYLTRIFKGEFAKTPTKYLLELRITKAKKLMQQQPDLEMKEISYLVGYADQGYFSRIFKKIVGVSPSEFKENQFYQSTGSL